MPSAEIERQFPRRAFFSYGANEKDSRLEIKVRNPVENISLLQKKINDLQLENQILKNILDRSGISYTHEIARISEPESAEENDPDQGHGLSIRDRSDHG